MYVCAGGELKSFTRHACHCESERVVVTKFGFLIPCLQHRKYHQIMYYMTVVYNLHCVCVFCGRMGAQYADQEVGSENSELT